MSRSIVAVGAVALACSGCGGCDPRIIEGGACRNNEECPAGWRCAMGHCVDAEETTGGSGGDDHGWTATDAGATDFGGEEDRGATTEDGGIADSGIVMLCETPHDCAPDRWCEVGTGQCRDMGNCNDDGQCAQGHLCDLSMAECKCLSDESCAGWPYGKVVCQPVLKKCMRSYCLPACRPNCEECVHSNCVYAEGKECCGNGDCGQPDKTICDAATSTCRPPTCGDPCISEDDCRQRCYGTPSCVSGRCEGGCDSDSDCATYCTAGSGTCDDHHLCGCDPDLSMLCSDCSGESNPCDRAGLMCGAFTKKCILQCQSDLDCTDKDGKFYPCNTTMGFCDCLATCCQPPCQSPQVCDEGAMCTCK